ncbi:MAG: hypothetical protein NTW44_03195 [Nitrospirae bacterium]|nr:hypothetical protein [Nitrospirota bacterium]
MTTVNYNTKKDIYYPLLQKRYKGGEKGFSKSKSEVESVFEKIRRRVSMKKVKSLLVLLVMITALLSTVVISYAFTITDQTGAEEWRNQLQKEVKESIEKGPGPASVKAVMSTLPPAAGAMMVAFLKNDRDTIAKMALAIDSHPPLDPKTRAVYTKGNKDISSIEWVTYGLEAHYWNQRLLKAAEDKNVEMNVVLHHFNNMIERCIRCHERFRDTK